MFRSITFNGTDKKQIGAPIIRKTNEMIYEFDLQYERNYKIVKVISQREIEFQEYLKQQEALQFRLDNLIKILRNYFKENNFNSNTYYALFKPTRIRSIKKRKKRRKKIRPKSAEIKHNKYIYYKATKDNFYFNKFKPYLYPLTNKDKKRIERKINTDINAKEKVKNNLSNMTPAQLKRFVDVFGFIPMIFHKDDKDDEEKEKKRKKLNSKNLRNFSSNIYSFGKNKSNRNFGNKKLENINMKRGISGRLMDGNKYMVNKFGNMNNINNISNSNSYNTFIKNIMDSNRLLNIKNNKNNLVLPNTKLPKYNIINKNINNYNIYNKKINNINNYNIFKNSNNLNNINTFKINSMSNSYNNIFFNKQYYNIYNNSNSANSINNNKISSLFNSKRNKNTNNNINNINTKDGKIKIRRNSIENLKKYSFNKQCIKTIQKSEVLNKDIEYLNKAYDVTGENFNTKTNKIENKTFKKIDFISMLEIYKKDFRPDIKKELNKNYEHIKEDLNGHIQVKKIEFVRKPKSRLNFVRVYNKRRDQKNNNKVEFIYNNNDEEKSDLIPLKMKKSLGRVKLNRNILKKNKPFSPSSVN